MNRRTFLKGTLAAAATGLAVGAGLLSPRMVLASWDDHKAGFDAKAEADTIKAMGGIGDESADISITAPELAENGAIVPITIESKIADTQSISILAEKNTQPLVAIFEIGESMASKVSVRIKLGKTGNVTAVVKAGGKSYHAKRVVKVTAGGC